MVNALASRDPCSHLFKTPFGPYDLIRDQFDREVRTESQAAHYFFYLSNVIFASKKIEKLLKNGNVYCSRYLIDTVVSHRAAGLNVDLEYENSLYSIRKPDLTIFMNLDEDSRQKRITLRGKSQLDKVLDDDETRDRFLQEFNRLSEHFVVIDNDESGIDGAVRAALSCMPWLSQHV